MFSYRPYTPPSSTQPRASTLAEDNPRRQAYDRAWRSLQGLATGDALGERFFGPPTEKLAQIIARVLPAPTWRYTDDTEMALSIVDVLDQHDGIDQDHLAYSFAWRFSQDRGYGAGAWNLMRHLRVGADWREASAAMFGGQGSYGNGGAMRSAPIGAYFADDLDRAAAEARRSAEVTHQHPEGIAGTVAVAVAAALSWQQSQGAGRSVEDLFAEIITRLDSSETRKKVRIVSKLAPNTVPAIVAERVGSGREISAQDTVPFCLWCAIHHLESFEEAFWATVSGLGDRDTTCAIVGGIVAAQGSPASQPPQLWVDRREKLEITPVVRR